MDQLVCITDKVNTGQAHTISSEHFEGKVVINIKGFTNPSGEVLSADYFDREDRKGITWSIQVQGVYEKLLLNVLSDGGFCVVNLSQAGSCNQIQQMILCLEIRLTSG
jgi:hypothetical protein